jgi:putative transposase
VELVGVRCDVAFVVEKFGYSERAACKLVGIERSSYRYSPKPDRNDRLRSDLLEVAKQKPRYGYRRLWVLLQRRGWNANVKRVYRLYRQEHLAVRRLRRKRIQRVATPATLISRPNQEWALDFVSDSLGSGRGIRCLTMVDSYTRECPAIEVDGSLSSRRVTRTLDKVIEVRGVPASLRCDNGPEFTSRHFVGWCEERGINLVHIQPGKPMQNGHSESFNGRFRDEFLNATWFSNIFDARSKTEQWRKEYNSERPHSSLAYRTPAEFAADCSELTSGMFVIPPGRPPTLPDSRTVLAGKGTPSAAPDGAPLPAVRGSASSRSQRRAAPAG